MSSITNDVQQIQVAVSETVGDLLREGLSIVGFAALMFYYDYKLALVVRHRRAGGRLSARAPRAAGAAHQPPRCRKSSRYLSHITIEAFTGHRIVKAFGAEAHEGARFRARVASACTAPT